MTVIVEPEPVLASMFRSAAGEPCHVVQSIAEAKDLLQQFPEEYAVVVGTSVDIVAGFELAGQFRVSRPALSVILVRRRLDTAVLTEAIRAGIREVLEESDLPGLTASVQRAGSLSAAFSGPKDSVHAHRGRLITVFSPKGGVGKSTLATNLSAALVDVGHARVCLVDLDLGFGDVAVMLQQFPAHTIWDAVSVPELDETVLESLLTTYTEGLCVLPAPRQPNVKDQVRPDRVYQVLDLLKQAFDYVVVDSAPELDEVVLQAFDHSDLVLLVVTPDVPTLKSTKVAGSTLDLLNIPADRRHVVLNRADPAVGLSRGDVERTLGASLATVIPFSRDVPACVNRGVLIVRDQPRHVVTKCVSELARLCLAPTRAPQPHARAKAEPMSHRAPGKFLRRRVSER